MKNRIIAFSSLVLVALSGCDTAAYEKYMSDMDIKKEAPVISLLGNETMTVKEGQKFTDPGATVYDRQDGDLTSKMKVTSTLPKALVPGEYTIDYRVVDSDGNVATKKRIVKVLSEDNKPKIYLIGSNPLEVYEGREVNDPGVIAMDPEDGDITDKIGITRNFSDTSIPGTYSIYYRVMDSSGEIVTEERKVIVRGEGEKPNSAPEITLIGEDNGTINLTSGEAFSDPGAIAYDKEDGDLTSHIKVTRDFSDVTKVGVHHVYYSVKDSSGVWTSKARTINVAPKTSGEHPLLTLLGGTEVIIAEGDPFVDPGFIAIDGKDGDLSNSVVVTKNFDSLEKAGIYYIYYKVTNSTGAISSAERKIVIKKKEANRGPVITLLGSSTVTIEEGEDFADPGAIAIDFEEGDISPKINVRKDFINTKKAGTYHVFYTVSDSSGNLSQIERTIIVKAKGEVANRAPFIKLLGSPQITLFEGDTFADPGVIAFDSEDGILTSFVNITKDFSNTDHAGTYHVYYTVTDKNGLFNSISRTVVIQSKAQKVNTPPEITLIGNSVISIEMGGAYADPGVVATDNEDGVLTGNVRITKDFSTTSNPGTYHIYYTVADKNGAVAYATREIVINPKNQGEKPVITLLGSSSISIVEGDEFVDPGVIAIDAEDGDVSHKIELQRDFKDTNAPGTYHVYYKVTDSSGHVSVANRILVVLPKDAETNTPPSIKLIGDGVVTITKGSVLVDPGAVATDKEEGDLTGSIKVTKDFPDTDRIGTFHVYYTVSDGKGVVNTITRVINIRPKSAENNTPPSLKLIGEPVMHIQAGNDFEDPGVVATDNEDGVLTGNVRITKDFSTTSRPGAYHIYYTIYDSNGEVASISRELIIGKKYDGPLPIITMLGGSTVTIKAGGTFFDPGIIAVDGKDGDLSDKVKTRHDFDNFQEPGEYHIYYTVTNSEGAISYVMRTINVEPNAGPVITLLGSSSVSLTEGDVFADPGAIAVDKEEGDITSRISVHRDFVDSRKPGTYHVYYTVSDAGGSVTTAFRTINVQPKPENPNNAPVLSLVGEASMVLTEGEAFSDPGAIASDVEDGGLTDSIRTSRDFADTNKPGTYHVYYSVIDSKGAVSSISRLVTVIEKSSESNNAPEITLLGDSSMTIPVSTEFSDPGAIARDIEDDDLTDSIRTSKDFADTNTTGTYHVYYTVSDSNGAISIATREVIVQ